MRLWPPYRRFPWLAWALVFVVLFFAAGSFFALRLWFHPWAPRIVRMLPEGKTLVYLDFEPLRTAGWLEGEWGNGLGGVAPIARAPAYAAFVHESGFDFERDLDAIAVSLRGSPTQPDETTCVLEGRFPPQFLAYLQAHALRRLRLGRDIGYQFPGWARPEQAITVVALDRRHALATNAHDPAAVVARARGWRLRSPALWQARLWSPPPIGYLAIDALRLAAARQLDGSSAPWQGAQRLQVRLHAGLDARLTLQGEEQTVSAEDAARTRDWAETEIRGLQGLLPEGGAGRLTLRGLLDRLVVTQEGERVRFKTELAASNKQ